MDIEDSLRYIVAQLINMMGKKVLLFISGGAVNIKDIFETLASMKMLQYDIVITDAAKKVIPEEYITNLNNKLLNCKAELTKAVRDADLILIPAMTRNTLAKCATGIEDNLVTTGIAEALMMNKQIIAVKDSFDPENYNNISLGYNKNPVYNKFILGYKDVLTDFGIQFIDSENLKSTMKDKFLINTNILSVDKTKEDEHQGINELNLESKNINKEVLSGVLTTEDIIVASNNSKEIYVKKGIIITPLARDYIDNNKIEIKYCE